MEKVEFDKLKIDVLKGKVSIEQLKKFKCDGTKEQFFCLIQLLKKYKRNFGNIYFPIVVLRQQY